MNKCKTCGINCIGDYCFKHKPKKPLKKSFIKVNKKPPDVEAIDKMKVFFMSIWNKIPHYSVVSGTYLGQGFSSLYLHHILPKSKYPEAMYDVQNIAILTPAEHAQVEIDMYRYEIINQKRIYLMNKYFKYE
jgi:hypothetical protein